MLAGGRPSLLRLSARAGGSSAQGPHAAEPSAADGRIPAGRVPVRGHRAGEVGMRIPVRARESGMRFNITPLIDICFNLIVFFGLSSLYVKKEMSQPITLPDAHQVDATNDCAFRRLIVTLDANRRMLVGGEKVTASEIDHRIRDGQEKARRFEVRIR